MIQSYIFFIILNLACMCKHNCLQAKKEFLVCPPAVSSTLSSGLENSGDILMCLDRNICSTPAALNWMSKETDGEHKSSVNPLSPCLLSPIILMHVQADYPTVCTYTLKADR